MSIRLNPYLIFNGNAREAIYFYEKALGGQIMGIMSFGDMPSVSDHPVPEEARDLVMHALLKVGDTRS
jgi:PhnB protein